MDDPRHHSAEPQPGAGDAAAPAGEFSAVLTDDQVAALKLWFPHPVTQIAHRFGNLVALRFARAFGGKRIFVPPQASPDHPIAEAFGLDVHVVVVRALHQPIGDNFDFPTGAQAFAQINAAEIWLLSKRGEKREALAQRFGLHPRTISFRKKAGRALMESRAPARPAATVSQPARPSSAASRPTPGDRP